MELDSTMDESSVKSEIKNAVWGCDELLKDPNDLWPLTHPLAGHCYVASECFYHLTGGKERWQVERVLIEVQEPGPLDATTEFTHWYLRERETDTIVDITAEQFTEYEHEDIIIPYENGTPTGFLTKKPSKRTQKLFEKLSVEY